MSEKICHDSIREINKYLNLHHITNPDWQKNIVLENVPHHMLWENLSQDKKLQEKYLLDNNLPLPVNNNSYLFENGWYIEYELYKYKENFLNRILPYSHREEIPYSLELKVFPNVVHFHKEGNIGMRSYIKNGIIIRVLFPETYTGAINIVHNRWKNIFIEKPDFVVYDQN